MATVIDFVLTACSSWFRRAIVPCSRFVLGAACLVVASGVASSKTPVLLSTDVGNEIDDQWAITYMLTNPAFDVQGIVSAHAPSLPAPTAHSTYKVLVDAVEHRLGMVVHPPLL